MVWLAPKKLSAIQCQWLEQVPLFKARAHTHMLSHAQTHTLKQNS